MPERQIDEKRKIEVDGTEGSVAAGDHLHERRGEEHTESFRDEWERPGEDVRTAFRLPGNACRSGNVQVQMEEGQGRRARGKVPTSAEMQAFVDLCYLTCHRSTDIHELRWSQVNRQAGATPFIPSKTAESNGESVDWPITPEIGEVLRRAKEIQRGLKYKR